MKNSPDKITLNTKDKNINTNNSPDHTADEDKPNSDKVCEGTTKEKGNESNKDTHQQPTLNTNDNHEDKEKTHMDSPHKEKQYTRAEEIISTSEDTKKMNNTNNPEPKC